jgi:superoxide dismutase
MSIFTAAHALPALKYSYDALEPYLDTATMYLNLSKVSSLNLRFIRLI